MTLKNKLTKLENEGVEKTDLIMEDIKRGLRDLAREEGKEVVLASLSAFSTLNTLRAFVEQLPNTAKDNAATLVKVSLTPQGR
jgi:uncharacterized protein YsxB (DUF464 family)